LQLLCTRTKLEEMRFSFWLVLFACGTKSIPLQDAKITNHWGYEVVWCACPRCFGCQDLCRLHASERYAQCRLSADQLRRDSNKRNGLVGALHLPHHMSPELPQTLKTSEDYIAVEDVRFG
jgi:hypothetical protein